MNLVVVIAKCLVLILPYSSALSFPLEIGPHSCSQ